MHSVLLHPKAKDSLDSLEEPDRRRIIRRLKDLRHKPASGRRMRLGEFYVIRIGRFRAIYEIDSKEGRVVVLFVGDRRSIYDKFDHWYREAR